MCLLWIRTFIAIDADVFLELTRYTCVCITQNGLESTLRAAEAMKEQRQERHQELQRRILQTELHSPSNRSNLTIPSPASMLSPGHASDTSVDDGSISPLKAPASSTGEDMFSKVFWHY